MKRRTPSVPVPGRTTRLCRQIQRFDLRKFSAGINDGWHQPFLRSYWLARASADFPDKRVMAENERQRVAGDHHQMRRNGPSLVDKICIRCRVNSAAKSQRAFCGKGEWRTFGPAGAASNGQGRIWHDGPLCARGLPILRGDGPLSALTAAGNLACPCPEGCRAGRRCRSRRPQTRGRCLQPRRSADIAGATIAEVRCT